MRLLRFINEQMTKPTTGAETSNEQPVPEARIEQEGIDENDCTSTNSPGTANGI